MLLSEAEGRKVISTATAEPIGHLSDLVIDFARAQVAALSLTKTPGSGHLLMWNDVTAFGIDAITTGGADRLRQPEAELADLADKKHLVHRKRVLTTQGLQVGTVRDVDFDPQTGKILALLLEDRPVTGDRLLGSGSYAVVVRA